MTPKITSKEIYFLKNDPEESNIKPPKDYLSDFLLEKTHRIERFESRLTGAKIPGKNFLCAVIQISCDPQDGLQEKAKTTFEDTFNSLLNHHRGIWESINDTAFALAFWDFENETKASRLILSLKEKVSDVLNTRTLVGVSFYPFHKFTKRQTFENAIKAADHAAFFGPDTLIHFDATSLNIFGDRLYQLNHCELAANEYKKGLELEHKNINLLNSLGVCYAIMGKMDKATALFEKAMKINSNEPLVMYNIGLVNKINKDIDRAIVYLKKAHGIDNTIPEIELLLGNLLAQKGQLDQALPHLETASKLNPELGAAFRLKGEFFLEKGKYPDAAKEFNEAIKRNPRDAPSLSGYAKALEKQNRNLSIALTFAKNSVALDPANTSFKAVLNSIRKKTQATADTIVHNSKKTS